MNDTKMDFALLVACLIIILFLSMAKVHCQPERHGRLLTVEEDISESAK